MSVDADTAPVELEDLTDDVPTGHLVCPCKKSITLCGIYDAENDKYTPDPNAECDPCKDCARVNPGYVCPWCGCGYQQMCGECIL